MSGCTGDKGKGKAERHSTHKGAGSINKLTYSKTGTNGGTRFVLAGMTEGRRSTLGPRWVNRGSPIFGGHPWVPAEN